MNGSGSVTAVGLEGPGRAQRRIRWSELGFGLFVVAGFACAGALFYLGSVDREPVLSLRVDVARGEQIEPGDLRVVQLSTDGSLNVLSPERASEVEGRVALVDLPAGTPVTGGLFVDPSELVGAGDGVLGLSLDPGEYPSPLLGAGNVVRVVATGVDPAAGGTGVVVLVDRAVVVEVSAVAGGADRLFVSLVMPTEEADAVVAAAADDRVRLIQVGG